MTNDRRFTIGLLALFAIQILYFYSYFAYEIRPFPPDAWDQAVYLSESYTLSESAQTHGLMQFAFSLFGGLHPQGVLFPVEGAALNLFAGGGRLSQVTLNFFALFSAEWILYSCVARTTGFRGLGLAAVGLFMLQHTIWNQAGGLFDFRIDFLAVCLYGAWVCVALRSDVFFDRRWSMIAGLISTILVLNRFVSVTYISGVMIFLIIVFAMQSKDPKCSIRLKNAAISFGVMICGVTPFIATSWPAINKYYVVGHLTGNEKTIRAAEFGLVNWKDHLTYYPLSIARDHLGVPFSVGCLLIWGTILFSCIRQPTVFVRPTGRDIISEMALVVGSVLIPLAVLDIDISKSPVVGSIVDIPLILIAVLLPRWIGLIDRSAARRTWWLTAGGAVVVVLGLITQLNFNADTRSASRRESYKQWARTATWIFDDALSTGLKTPHIFFDTISSHLNEFVITSFGYEQTGILLGFHTTFPQSLFNFEKSEALAALDQSDYVVLTGGVKAGVYPFFASMAPAEPEVRKWANDHLIFRARFHFDSQSIDIYAKPHIAVGGISGDWLLARGTYVSLRPRELTPNQVVVLRGPETDTKLIPVQPSVLASAEVPGRRPISIPAFFKRLNGQYEIVIDPAALRDLPDDIVDVTLEFDRYFVPKEVGMNSDTRELVVRSPTERRVGSITDR